MSIADFLKWCMYYSPTNDFFFKFQEYVPHFRSVGLQSARAQYNHTPVCYPVVLGIDDLITEPSFDSQAALVIGVHGLFFAQLSMGVCTTKHWQTSGRLLQELNVCTVIN